MSSIESTSDVGYASVRNPPRAMLWSSVKAYLLVCLLGGASSPSFAAEDSLKSILEGQGDSQNAEMSLTAEETTRNNAALVASEEWRFFTSPERSALDLGNVSTADLFRGDSNHIRGDFAISASGTVPGAAFLTAEDTAPELTNVFSLALQGRVENTIVAGPDFPVSFLADVRGRLTISSRAGHEWELTVTQENFGIMGATFQTSQVDGRVRVYVPAMLQHEKSGAKLHVQIYMVFSEGENGALAIQQEEDLIIRRTRNERIALSSNIKLAQLLGDSAETRGANRSMPLMRFTPAVISLEGSGNSQVLGTLTDSPVVRDTLCTADVELPACSADRESLTVLVTGAPKRGDDGAPRGENWQLEIQFYPGASAKGSDGRVVNYVESFSGVLSAGSNAFEVKHSNVASLTPRTFHDAATDTIELSFPAKIGNSGDPRVMGVIAVTCLREEGMYRCPKASISDSTSSFGGTIGDRSVNDLQKSYHSDSIVSQAIAGQFDAIANAGCQLWCPTCQALEGCAGSIVCGIATHPNLCQPGTSQSTCCASNVRNSCRVCTVSGGGGGGCAATSTDTLVFDLGSTENWAAPPSALRQGSSCGPTVLRSLRIFDSGLRVVTDDWSLLGKSSDSVDMLASSRSSHATERAECLQLSPVSGPYLAIDFAKHQMNARHIHTPEVSLRGIQGEGRNRMVAQLEYDDEGQFYQAELIYSDSVLADPTAMLVDVRSKLDIAYHSQKRHALTVYAFIEHADGESIDGEFLVTMPNCCPGDCGPGTGWACD